jgi:hypothetical protein
MYQKAIECYDKALEIDPQEENARRRKNLLRHTLMDEIKATKREQQIEKDLRVKKSEGINNEGDLSSRKNLLQFNGFYRQVMTDLEIDDYFLRMMMSDFEETLLFFEDGTVIRDSPLKENLVDMKKYYETKLKPSKRIKIPYKVDDEGNLSFIQEFQADDGEQIRNVFEGKIEGDVLNITATTTIGGKHKKVFQFYPMSEVENVPEKSASYLDQIKEINLTGDPRSVFVNHLKKFLGNQFVMLQSPPITERRKIQLDYYVFPPTSDFNFWKIISFGMSHYQMPGTNPYNAHCELMVFLNPNDWNLNIRENRMGRVAFQNYPSANIDYRMEPDLNWPIRGMNFVNIYPFLENTWVGPFHTINMQGTAMGDYYAWFLTNQTTIHPNLNSLLIGRDHLVNFYLLIPVYKDELNKIQASGDQFKLDIVQKKVIPEVISQRRARFH